MFFFSVNLRLLFHVLSSINNSDLLYSCGLVINIALLLKSECPVTSYLLKLIFVILNFRLYLVLHFVIQCLWFSSELCTHNVSCLLNSCFRCRYKKFFGSFWLIAPWLEVGCHKSRLF